MMMIHRSISPVQRSNDATSTKTKARKMTFHSTKHGAERPKATNGGGASRLVVRSVAFGRS